MPIFPRELRTIIQFVSIVAAFFFAALLASAQVGIPITPAAPQSQSELQLQTQSPLADDVTKHPELLKEFGNLFTLFQNNIQYPAPRSESQILPFLPPSTTFYAAVPNYGQASDQALKILRQELQGNATFRDWWHQGEMAATGPKIEDALQKFSELNAFLGEELVLSGALDGKEPSLVFVAKVRKPGLKKYLPQMFRDLAGSAKPHVRVLDPQELAAAVDNGASQDIVILVRPDFVVAAKNLAAVRSFNARLDQPGREFAATSFGKRVSGEYQGGLTVLTAADLQRIVDQVSPATKQSAAFQQSGFAGVKYLVAESRRVDAKSITQLELSFNGPRRGAAAWIAKSGPLSSLDFVSPDAILSLSLLLTNPAKIFDDVRGLVSLSNPEAFASLPMFEQALHLSVKDDLLGLLAGDLTVELDSAAPPKPEWRVILGVTDTDHLRRTLSTLFTAANFVTRREEVDGVGYYSLRIPTPKTVSAISYALVDGHLIVGSSQGAVADSINLHRSGESLAKSTKLQAALPPGQSLNASGLFYEDPVAMAALQMKNFAPGVIEALSAGRKDAAPSTAWVYGEDSAIREVSSNSKVDVGAVLIAAAIAIPNMIRSRMAANEASAVATARAVNTAQVSYKTSFPQRGYAASLPMLGPDPNGGLARSPDHSGLLADSLAGESCSPDGWCLKSGFRFKLAAVCAQRRCQEYVLLAVPVTATNGGRNFCSTSDGVIRATPGAPWEAPLTASDCKGWPPIQ